MKRAFVYLFVLWALALAVNVATAATSPARTVEKLAFARELKADQGTSYTVRSVKCASTTGKYIFACNFVGVYGDKKVCVATYVHYHAGHTGRYTVNFWAHPWACGTRPPAAPPAYPGDAGPKA